MSGPKPGDAFTVPGREAPPRGHPPELVREEGPYIVRWGRREAGLAALGTALLAGLAAALAAWSSPWWLVSLALVLPAGALGVLFFRNPARMVPGGPGILVAPADGRVVEVEEVEEAEYIGGPALKVAIFLSIFDVHLNRAPCSGRVEYLCRREGKFLDARNPDSARQNERQAIGILRGDRGGPPGARVLVRQVAGAIARRIVCPLEEGQEVERGRLVGMIKYGSRTEVLVSVVPGGPRLESLVKVGDKVRAGASSILGYTERS